MTLSIGLCFHRDAPAGAVIEQARVAEEAGYDELWVIEDCFFTAGVSLAAAALTATRRIGVGIGIMPAVARNPAITAMEIATLAGLAPGRFHAGIGHGVQDWMGQMGVRPTSPLTTLEETLMAVRSLIRGEEVTTAGRAVQLDRVRLEAPPDPVPLVSAGVRGPRSLAASGRSADGTILADFCSVEYLTWARAQISRGSHSQSEHSRSSGTRGSGANAPGAHPPVAEHHRLTVFASAAVTPDGDDAREAMSYYLAEVCQDPPTSLRHAPFFDEVEARAAASSWLEALQAMPADWWRQLGPIGTPDDAVAYLSSMAEAGADAVALFPSPVDPVGDATNLASAVLPHVSR